MAMWKDKAEKTWQVSSNCGFRCFAIQSYNNKTGRREAEMRIRTKWKTWMEFEGRD